MSYPQPFLEPFTSAKSAAFHVEYFLNPGNPLDFASLLKRDLMGLPHGLRLALEVLNKDLPIHYDSSALLL